MLNDWVSVTRAVQDNDFAIWDHAWYRTKATKTSQEYAANASGKTIYVLRIAQWYPAPSLRGKFLVRDEAEGMAIGRLFDAVPGTTVPHVFDSLEEAQAVYDLIVDKE